MKKYKPGKVITSLDELAKQDFVIVRHKVYHTGWFSSWPLRSCRYIIQAGLVYSAEQNDKEGDHE